MELSKRDLQMILLGHSASMALVETQIDGLSKIGMPDVIYDLVTALTHGPDEGVYMLIKNYGYDPSDFLNEMVDMAEELATLMKDLGKATHEAENLDKENLS